MKKLIANLSLLFVFASMEAQDFYEPNDYFNQAAQGSFGTSIESFIWEPYDEDYYAFEVSGPGFFHIRILGVPSNIDLQAFLFLPDTLSAINFNTQPSPGEAYDLFGSTCQSGAHFLKLRDRGLGSGGGSSWNQNESYLVIVDFYPFPFSDPCECSNGTNLGACTIASFDTISALIAPPFGRDGNFLTRDLDYYKFFVSEPSLIKVHVQEAPANYALDLFLFDPDELQFWSDYTHDSLGHTYSIAATTCAIGDHYLQFRAGNGWAVNGSTAFNGFEQYVFSVEIEPLDPAEDCECENNTFENACLISVCDTTEAFINAWFGFNDANNIPSKDVDLYKLDLMADEEVTVALTSVPENIDLVARVFDASYNILDIESGAVGQPFAFSFFPSQSGIHYIEVMGDGGSFNLEDTYQITVGCGLVNTANEPSPAGRWMTFPNPFHNQLVIQGFRDDRQDVDVQILSLEGEILFRQLFPRDGSMEINAGFLAPGLYLLHLISDDQVFVQKLIRG